MSKLEVIEYKRFEEIKHIREGGSAATDKMLTYAFFNIIITKGNY